MKKTTLLLLLLILLSTIVHSFVFAGEPNDTITEKTFVVWVSPQTLDQKGGSVLTLNNLHVDLFDGIVFAELSPRTWMPGSNAFSRTNRSQADWPRENVFAGPFVQIAVTYQKNEVTMYRNGEVYTSYPVDHLASFSLDECGVLFGQRHYSPGCNDFFVGRIRDARIYAAALDQATIAAMKPGEAIPGCDAWAWWDFSTTGTYERMNRFKNIELSADVFLEDGCLVLQGSKPRMLSWNKEGPLSKAGVVSDTTLITTRELRKKFLQDPYRPRYHFAIPEGMGMPGDPNGCFYANGRYHLMYLYDRVGSGFCWGHISSHDLLHWRHHPDAIGPGDGDDGCFSGGAFLDDDGTAYLSYWMLWGDKGLGLAKSNDADYDFWTKLPENPVVKSTEMGITEKMNPDGSKTVYGSADPTNIWKKGGKYYMCGGNLLVLNKYGREPGAPAEFAGDHLALFESENLTDWVYKGEFYERNPKWTDSSEDNMCPSFLPLPSSPDGGVPSSKHLLLFISHNKGCQYFVGTYDTTHDQFLPENHGRMTWVDNTFFAPEALIDGQGRQIFWSWLLDNPSGEKERGWSGVYGLPRTLWLGEDGTLRMKPVPELENLRADERRWNSISLRAGEQKVLENIRGDSCELEMTVPQAAASRYGVKVRVSPDGEEETRLYYDATEKTLVFDSTRSGIDGRKCVESAPLTLGPDEPLKLRVFIDQSVVEVYANDRQAVCRRVYPGRNDSLGVILFAENGEAVFTNVKSWTMMPSNPY